MARVKQLPILDTKSFASHVKSMYSKSRSLTELMDIIEFTQSVSGLNVKLYPAQRVILRLFYGLKLVDKLQEPIIIKDELNQHTLYTFYSELEFVDFLYEQKRINVNSKTYQDFIESKGVSEVVFICGRRASKTTLTSIITCYILYVLLSIKNPHEYFGVLHSDAIGVALVSNNLDGAKRTFNAVSDLIYNCKFFQNYIGGTFYETLWLKSDSYNTDADLGVIHQRPGNISITSYASNANVRGASNIVVVIDEIAHFRDADVRFNKDKMLDSVVYEALYPSILGFVDEYGNGVGKSFIMSSPNGKKGLLYDMYNKSFDNPNTLMINTPSHWINNRISSKDLVKIKQESENSFKQEILAEFVDKETNWISDINRLYACFNRAATNECRQRHSYVCYAGFDLGLSNDSSVLAIGHFQEDKPLNIELDKPEYLSLLADNKFYVIDYVHIWSPSADGTPIDPEVVINDLSAIFKRFNVRSGTYDQFSHSLFTYLLSKSPHVTLKMESATRDTNSQRAVLTKRLISEGRLLMPNIARVRDEWQTLQEEVFADGKIRVSNDIGHDDTYSAITRCVEQIYFNTEVKAEPYVANRPPVLSNINHKLRQFSYNTTRNARLSQRVYR